MPATIQVPPGPLTEPFNFSPAAEPPLGTKLITFDGREFRFGENGAVAAVAGSLYQSEVPNAADDDIVVAAAAVGALTVSITSNAEAIVADEFNGGYLVAQDDAGEGRAYLITDHPGADASAATTITLAYGIEVALTAATTVLLLKHPMKDVIIHPSPPTAPVVGVAAAAVPANQFGWFQTLGMASVLQESDAGAGVPVIGQEVRPSELDNGAVTLLDYDEATQGDLGGVGVCAEPAIDTEHAAIILSIRN